MLPGGESTGSGFVISYADGRARIVTNAHVISNTESDALHIVVTLHDGTTAPARVHSIDEESDICLLDMEAATPVPVLPMGVSGALRAGEWVVAIGSPLSLRNSVTVGVVSNTHRAGKDIGVQSVDPHREYIQVDAAINTGNSGGPVVCATHQRCMCSRLTQVNLDGEVVGIATMKALADGIGFAIPIDHARAILAQLEKHGMVRRPYLGLQLRAVDAAMVQSIIRSNPELPMSPHVRRRRVPAALTPRRSSTGCW